MCPLTLLPTKGLLHLERLLPETGVITLVASTCQPHAACPRCGHTAERVHNRSTRTVTDLHWQGVAADASSVMPPRPGKPVGRRRPGAGRVSALSQTGERVDREGLQTQMGVGGQFVVGDLLHGGGLVAGNA